MVECDGFIGSQSRRDGLMGALRLPLGAQNWISATSNDHHHAQNLNRFSQCSTFVRVLLRPALRDLVKLPTLGRPYRDWLSSSQNIVHMDWILRHDKPCI